MARYDWGRGYGPDRGYGRTAGDYASDFGSWGAARRSARRSGPWGPGGGGYDRRYTPGIRGYDRGLYGGAYPSYGGYPGGEQRGMYYGGRGGYDSGLRTREGAQRYRGARGYDWGLGYGTGGGYGSIRQEGAPWSAAAYGMRSGHGSGRAGSYGGGYEPGPSGYDTGFAHAPFVPEEAYHRHPELERQQAGIRGRWPERGHGYEPGDADLDDDEVSQAVRQNLYQDNWIQPDDIEVEVDDGVVTLTGEVGDYMEARYAWDDAWETAGVRGVINNLTVRTDQPHEEHGDVVPQTTGAKKKASGGKKKK